QRRDQAAAEDDRLAPNAIGQRPEHYEERRADRQRQGNQDIGSRQIDLQRLGQEEQSVELPTVPYHGLAGGEAEQGDDDDLEVRPVGKPLGQRRRRAAALGFHALEGWTFVELKADPYRDGQQQHRDQERDAPAPAVEIAEARRVALGIGAGDDAAGFGPARK